MISTLWFLIKTCFVIAVFALILNMGGTVQIDFRSYTMVIGLGVFILALFLTVWCVSILYRTLAMIVSAPKALQAYREGKAHHKGLQALAYGLSAVAAGDVRSASHYTDRVVKYLKGDDVGLSDLMTGLTARMQGDDVKVNRAFHAMMMHKETSFLGLKGLLQTAIDKKDYRYAVILAEKAYKQHPTQPWIIKTLYDLYIRSNRYDDAAKMLKHAEKAKVITKKDASSQRAALLMGQGQMSKAYKLAPTSLPVGLQLLEEWAKDKKRRKSINLIKTLWAQNPHPTLMDYWIKYAPKKTLDNPASMAVWVEDLQRENAGDASSFLYAGQALVNMGQKSNAQRFVKQAVAGKPTPHACQLMYSIDGSQNWIRELANAPQDKAWVCTKTGHIHSEWRLVTNEGFFNCLVWAYPDSVTPETDTPGSPFLLAA